MTLRSRLALTLVCFLLGVGLVAQLRARRTQSPSSVPSKDQSELLGSLVVANAELRNEVQKVEGEIQAYQRASDRAVLPQMVEEMGNMRIVNGRVQVTGGGVEMRVGAGVSVIDLQDLLNELRNAGAEAIALNGHRLTIRTALTADQRGTVKVEGVAISPPFVFQAIGEPATMATALNRPGGVPQYLRATYPGLELTIKTAQLVTLPAGGEGQQFVLAQPVKQQ